MKAIFLDRDGTLNEEVDYLLRKEDIKLIEGTIEALDIFKKLGFLNIIITNQSAIARGYLTLSELESIHKELMRLLRKNGNNLIDGIYFSPYHTEGIVPEFRKYSEDRKPGAGLIEKAKLKFNIEPDNSFLIGDSVSDIQCGFSAGIKTVLVLTGYGKITLKECEKEKPKLYYIAENLLDAANFIKNKSKE